MLWRTGNSHPSRSNHVYWVQWQQSNSVTAEARPVLPGLNWPDSKAAAPTLSDPQMESIQCIPRNLTWEQVLLHFFSWSVLLQLSQHWNWYWLTAYFLHPFLDQSPSARTFQFWMFTKESHPWLPCLCWTMAATTPHFYYHPAQTPSVPWICQFQTSSSLTALSGSKPSSSWDLGSITISTISPFFACLFSGIKLQSGQMVVRLPV